MRSPDFYSGLLWLLVGAYIVNDAYGMGLGTMHDPGSGYVLFAVGIAIVLMSAFIAINGLLKAADVSMGNLFRGLLWRRVILLVSVLTVYSIVLEPVGFIPATLVLLLVLFRAVDPLTWPFAVFASVLTTAIVYVVFGPMGLGTQFPRGDELEIAIYYAVPGLIFALAVMFWPGAPKPTREA